MGASVGFIMRKNYLKKKKLVCKLPVPGLYWWAKTEIQRRYLIYLCELAEPLFVSCDLQSTLPILQENEHEALEDTWSSW